VAAELRRSIVDGALEPGSTFSISSVAVDLGVSHIPVREALRILEGEGLLVMRPSRRVLVRPLAVDDVKAIYRLRQLIEPTLTALGVNTLSDAELEHQGSLLSIYLRSDVSIAEELDAHQQFHLGLMRPTGSEWDIRVLEFLWNANRRYARLLFEPSNPLRQQRLYQAHHDLFTAVRSRS
jgi:DNA-binding GntR family transcriptional regulator